MGGNGTVAKELKPLRQEPENWAGEMGEKWRAHLDKFEAMIKPVGDALLEAAAIAPGETVIDIGCGAGPTTFQIAERVGARGSVTGLDIAPVLIEVAKERAKTSGAEGVAFVLGDASKTDVGKARFDCLFSRFGVMFFDDPYGAFAHMHGFLKPGGRLAMACWGPPQENAWITVLMALVRRYVDMPAPPPRAPGPLAFSEEDYVRDILGRAGFKDIALTAWRGTQYLGGPGLGPKQAAAFLKDALFVGEALVDAPEEIREKALREIEAVLETHNKPEGVGLPAMAWLITARA